LERDTIKLIRDLDQARDTITRLQNEISGLRYQHNELRDSLEEKGVLD
jgi:FtsZ-binding cell division protein ZapB